MARMTRTTKVTVGEVSKETKTVVDTNPTFVFMFPVESSNVEYVGHKDDSMFVRYKNESVYRFVGVTFETFSTILKSDSVGKAILATKIRGTKL